MGQPDDQVLPAGQPATEARRLPARLQDQELHPQRRRQRNPQIRRAQRPLPARIPPSQCEAILQLQRVRKVQLQLQLLSQQL